MWIYRTLSAGGVGNVAAGPLVHLVLGSLTHVFQNSQNKYKQLRSTVPLVLLHRPFVTYLSFPCIFHESPSAGEGDPTVLVLSYSAPQTEEGRH